MQSLLGMGVPLSTSGRRLDMGLKNFDDSAGRRATVYKEAPSVPGVDPAARAAIGTARRVQGMDILCCRRIGALASSAHPFSDGRKLLAFRSREPGVHLEYADARLRRFHESVRIE